MKLTIVEKKTFLAGLQCTLTSSCAKNSSTKFKTLFTRRLFNRECFEVDMLLIDTLCAQENVPDNYSDSFVVGVLWNKMLLL